MSTVSPKNPAACQRSAPRCMAQVTAVCRRSCLVQWSMPDAASAVRQAVLEAADALPVDLDHETGALALPAPQVCEQRARDRYGRGPLLGLSLARPAPIEHAFLGVHPSAHGVRHEAEPLDRVGPCAGVERHENEAGKVLRLGIAVRGPHELRRLIAAQPAVARRRLGGKAHARRAGDVALSVTVIDRRRQGAEFLSHCAGRPAALDAVPSADLARDAPSRPAPPGSAPAPGCNRRCGRGGARAARARSRRCRALRRPLLERDHGGRWWAGLVARCIARELPQPVGGR